MSDANDDAQNYALAVIAAVVALAAAATVVAAISGGSGKRRAPGPSARCAAGRG